MYICSLRSLTKLSGRGERGRSEEASQKSRLEAEAMRRKSYATVSLLVLSINMREKRREGRRVKTYST